LEYFFLEFTDIIKCYWKRNTNVFCKICLVFTYISVKNKHVGNISSYIDTSYTWRNICTAKNLIILTWYLINTHENIYNILKNMLCSVQKVAYSLAVQIFPPEAHMRPFWFPHMPTIFRRVLRSIRHPLGIIWALFEHYLGIIWASFGHYLGISDEGIYLGIK